MLFHNNRAFVYCDDVEGHRMMIRRFCDLDNTLIFSHRREIHNKIVVEYLNGKEQSFMPSNSYNELQKQGKKSIIPLTSRTVEQYKRIKLYGNGDVPEYALVDNGGILLINGVEDMHWKKETYQLISEKQKHMKKVSKEFGKWGEFKLQDNLVWFLKTDDISVQSYLSDMIENMGLIMFNHLNKIYICASELSKGNSIKRFISKYNGDYIISAGDSKVDCSMINYSDKCILSSELKAVIGEKSNVKYVDNESIGINLLKENRPSM